MKCLPGLHILHVPLPDLLQVAGRQSSNGAMRSW